MSCLSFVSLATAIGDTHDKLDLKLPPFGEINVMVLTDVHSWVSGHLPHEPRNDADYGDVLSFYEHLQAKSQSEEKDLFFVMNGDFIDGTGLSTNPPKYLTPILRQMPWDVVNIGNHELYKNSTIEFITEPEGFVDFWDGRYLTSNVVLSEDGSPIGERFRYLHGQFSNKTVLTFGFLFDFKRNCQMTTVENVQDVVNSSWFNNELENGEFDAIMVLAHMDYNDPLVEVILDRIRVLCGDDMPVQFITGHTHIRGNKQLDSFSSSFEAGRFLDTIGFVSFPTKKTSASNDTNHVTSAIPPTQASGSSSSSIARNVEFSHTFIDTTIETMKILLGVSKLKTENGIELSKIIQKTREELGLLKLLGCAPSSYSLSAGLQKSDSLWGLFLKQAVPEQLFAEYDGDNIFLQGTGALRYSLYEGNVTLDDLIKIAPFNDTVYLIDDQVKGEDIITAFGVPNYVDINSPYELPDFAFAGAEELDANGYYRVFTGDFNVEYVTKSLIDAGEKGRLIEPEIVENVTTGTLWSGFFETTWACDVGPTGQEDTDEPKDFLRVLRDFLEEFTALKVIAFVLTFVIIVFFGWMFVCRSHKRSMFAYSDSESGSDLSMFDDMSNDEYSSSEASQNSNMFSPKTMVSPQPKKVSYQSLYPADIEIL